MIATRSLASMSASMIIGRGAAGGDGGPDGADGSGETVEAGAQAPTRRMAAVRTARGRRR